MITINDWEPETRSLLHTLKNHGFALLKVDNGEDVSEFESVPYDEFVSECMACDESWLYVSHPSVGRAWCLYLVYGNSPGELVNDHHDHPLLSAAVEEHNARWDGKPVPTKEVAS